MIGCRQEESAKNVGAPVPESCKGTFANETRFLPEESMNETSKGPEHAGAVVNVGPLTRRGGKDPCKCPSFPGKESHPRFAFEQACNASMANTAPKGRRPAFQRRSTALIIKES